MSAGRLIDFAVSKRFSQRRLADKARRMLKVLEDEIFERAKSGIAGDGSKLKTSRSRLYLKRKTAIIQGRAKGKTARAYKSSRSVYKAERRTDTGRLTGFLFDSIEPKLEEVKAPRPNKQGKIRFRFVLNNSKGRKRTSISRSKTQLEKQVKGLRKNGYNIFPITKLLPETRKKMREILG